MTADIAFDEPGRPGDQDVGLGSALPSAAALIVRSPAPLGADAASVKTWFYGIVEAEAPVLDGSLAAEREAACAYARMAKAENTRRAYRAASCAVPTDDTAVSETLAGILRQILAPMPSDLRGLRDRALLLIGFAGALRRSELAAIRVEQMERTERGLRLTLHQTKGS